MEIKINKNTSMKSYTKNTLKTSDAKSKLSEQIKHLTNNEKINLDGPIELSNCSAMKLHSLLLEAERLGLSYSIQKSTTIRFDS